MKANLMMEMMREEDCFHYTEVDKIQMLQSWSFKLGWFVKILFF